MNQTNFGAMEQRNKGGRPRKPIEETKININIRLKPKEVQYFKLLAKELNCTFTDALRALILWEGEIDIQVIKTRLERLKTAN
jgi:hypothetical protein